MKLKTKKLNKKVISLYGMILMFVALITVGFAWFSGTIDRNGFKVQTGKIEVSADFYYYKDGELTKRSKNINEQADIAAIIAEADENQAYIIVNRTEESIDVDYSIDLTLENDQVNLKTGSIEDLKYVGGYWFKFKEITSDVKAIDVEGEYDNENQLKEYIEYTLDNNGGTIPNNATEKALNQLSSESYIGSLENSNLVNYYLLSFGYSQDRSQYYNKELKIRASLYVTQKGGLTDQTKQYTVGIYYVNTLAELLKDINIYKAGSTIIIQKDVTYSGDLVFTRPVNLVVSNSTLTVEGNLIYSFPYSDSYKIDTSGKGYIITRKVGKSGCDVEIDTPNASCQFIGKGKDSTDGDIYCQGMIHFNASYDDGVTLSGVNFCDTDENGNKAKTKSLKNLYFVDNTRIDISQNTKVLSIYPITAISATGEKTYSVKIVNYGQLDQLVLSGMYENEQMTEKPQIYFENYGTFGTDSNSRIILPTFATKYRYDYQNNSYISGNTRVIQRKESNNLHISESSTNFKDGDIELEEVTVFIVDNDPSNPDTDVTIYYSNYIDADKNEYTPDLLSIINKHYDSTFRFNASNTLTAAQKTFAQNKLATYKKIKMVSYQGKVMSTSDLDLIRSYGTKNINELDLDELLIQNNTLYARSFEYMVNLTKLVIPNTTQYINNYAFGNLQLHEITIPASVKNIEGNGFTSMNGTYSNITQLPNELTVIHLLSKNTKYSFNSGTNMYTCVQDEVFDQYSSSYHVCRDGILSSDNEYIYRILDDGTYEIVRYVGGINGNYFSNLLDTNGNVTLGKFKDKNGNDVLASSIGDRAFVKYFNEVEKDIVVNKITFEDSVTNIDNYAFYGCTSKLITTIKEIKGKNVKTIGSYAFSNLITENIYFENLITVGNSAFYKSSIDIINLPKCKNIDNCAFYQSVFSKNENNFIMPNVEYIGVQSFYSSNIIVSDWPSLKSAGTEAFRYCNFQYFNAPLMESAGICCWRNNKSLIKIYAPNLSIYGEQFYLECPSLTQVYVGAFKDYVLNNDNNVGHSASSLQLFICGLTGDNSLARKGVATFSGSNITAFISDPVYQLYKGTWLYSLNNVINTGNIDPKELISLGSYVVNNLDIGEIVFGVDMNTKEASALYINPTTISSSSPLLVDGTYKIPDYVTIGETNYNVTSMRVGLFSERNFTDYYLEFPKYVKYYGGNEFKNSSKFKGINLGGIEAIDIDYQFYYMIGIEYIKANSLLYIYGSSVFCSNSMMVFEAYNLKEIKGGYTFQNCKNISVIRFPKLENIISRNIFDGCTGLNEIYLDSLVNIDAIAGIYNINNLKKFYAPKLKIMDDSSLFLYCYNLSEIYIGLLKSVRDSRIISITTDFIIYICGTSIDDDESISDYNITVINSLWQDSKKNVKVLMCDYYYTNLGVESINSSNKYSYINVGNVDPADLVKIGTNTTYAVTTNNPGEFICAIDAEKKEASIVCCTYVNIDNKIATSGTYTIPNTIEYNSETYNVTSIRNQAFLKTIINNVSISMGSNMKSIGISAFGNFDTTYTKKTITSINLGGADTILDYAFYDVSSSFTSCNNVTKIGDYAFYKANIPTLELGELSNIGKNAFEQATITTFTSTSTSLTIEEYAFYNANIDSFETGNITTINENAFNGIVVNNSFTCSNLLNIKDSVFENSKISSLTIGIVNTIGKNAFKGSTIVFTVNLNNLTSIGDYAFENAKITTNIESDSLTSVGENPFKNGELVGNFTANNLITLKKYQFANSKIGNVSLNSINVIPDYCFANSTIGNLSCSNCETIKQYAFNSCTAGNIDVNNTINIDTHIFDHTTATSIKLNYIIDATDYLFYYCNCNNIEIDSITTVGVSSFEYCTFKSSDWNAITSVDDRGFYQSAITGFESDVLTSVGAESFGYCNELEYFKAVNLHNYQGAFLFNCQKVIEVFIGQIYSTKTTSDSLICDCYQLRYLNICGKNPNTSYSKILAPTNKYYEGRYIVFTRTYNYTNYPLYVILSDSMYSLIGDVLLSGYGINLDGYVITIGDNDPLSLLRGESYVPSGYSYDLGTGRFIGNNIEKTAKFILTSCQNYTNVNYVIPNTIKSLDNTEDYKVTSIARSALCDSVFINCSVSLNDYITELPDSCFKVCKDGARRTNASCSITSFDLKNVTEISYACFAKYGIIDDFYGNNVLKIRGEALESVGIRRFHFPNLTSLEGYYIFYNNSYVEDIYFPNLESIKGVYTFNLCSSLKSIILPKLFDITLGNTQFSSDSSLEYLYAPKANLCMAHFSQNTHLKTVYCDSSSTFIYDQNDLTKFPNLENVYFCGNTPLVRSSSVTINKRINFYCDNMITYNQFAIMYSNVNLIYVGNYDLKTIVEKQDMDISGYTRKFSSHDYSLDGNNADLVASHLKTVDDSSFVISGNFVYDKVNYDVVKINQYAYKYTTINSNNIIIENNINEIGTEAFGNISNKNIYVLNDNSIIAESNSFGTGTNNKLYVHASMLSSYKALGSWNGISASNMYAFNNTYLDTSSNITYYYDVVNDEAKIVFATGTSTTGSVLFPSIIDGKNVTYVDSKALSAIDNLVNVTLPSSLVSFDYDNTNIPSTLKSYLIDSTNTYYKTDDGVLYSSDGKVLIAYPKAKEDDEYNVLSTVDMISSYAFADAINLNSISISSKVYVGSYAFASVNEGITINFTNTDASMVSMFIGYNTFGDVDNYTIDVDDTLIINYQNNVLVDQDIVSHIQ